MHPTKTTGSRGELKAAVIFADIGWAPPVKLSEDIGTDLVTFARDTAAPEEKGDAWDLGAPVFMQVKGSDSEYLKPTNKRKGQPGWWFAESDTYHFDHWLSFGLPYLLVLVDTENQIAYWAEVTGDAIVPTGKGRKIFVPAAQKVDADNAETLTKIAVSRRKYDLEGAVWSGSLSELGPADRLRNALILPRLVAPHPNKNIEELTFEEAAAMVMRNRYSELAYRGHQGQCPKTEEWEFHKDWGWRFVHALHELVTQGASVRFIQLAQDARHRFERDACLVLHACATYASDKPTEALPTVVPSKATRPADRGWLSVHQSAFLLELDRPAEAAAAAKRALVALKSLEGDLSVSAIRGGAASILYSVAGFAAGDIEATITAQDNAGNWWRAQDVNWALEKDLRLRFEGWTDNRSIQFIDSTARADLAVVAWNAAVSGGWSSWRHLTTMNAHLTFTSSDDPSQLIEALRSLVFVGEKKAAKNATRKMWMDEPVEPLNGLVHIYAYRPWSKREEGPIMGVLSEAGDLLDTKAADHVIRRILDLLHTEGGVRVHGSAWTYRWGEVDTALGRLLKAATNTSHREVANLIAAEFATCDDSVADSLVRVANALATPDLGGARLNRLLKAAKARDDHYGIDLLEAIAPSHAAAVAELRRHADAGNNNAVRSLLVAGSTKHDDFIAFGRSAARTVRTMVHDARGKDGTRKMTGYVSDQLDDLTLAALQSNDTKLWKEVTDALEACVIEQTQQQRAIRRLASRFQTLPPHVQRKLRKLAPDLRGTSFGFTFGGGRNEFGAAVAHLRIAAGTIPDLEVESLLLAERRNNPVGFVRTLGAWNSERKLPFLATTVVDENPIVRAQAGFSIVEHAHRFPADRDRAFAIIRSALMQENGCALVDGIAQGLAAYPDEKLADLDAALRNHPSAVIRARFVKDD
ncbi:hypothetical protein ASG74_04370 [Knoellia sp. Soil729]|nr:hypothetical protein ASG74_04370 [Knoellia sp. Soil729]